MDKSDKKQCVDPNYSGIVALCALTCPYSGYVHHVGT